MTSTIANTRTTMLTALVASAKRQTERRRGLRSEAELVRAAATAAPPRDFAAALRRPGLSIIAELKQRSPSKGALTRSYPLTDLARSYTDGGAAAISVLTHEEGFGGSPDHLRRVRAKTNLPLLRKDFLTDKYQILEARVLGADAVLLIAAVLSPEQLTTLLAFTRELGMEALVEVHSESEVEVALASGAYIVGVNHRDLHTFGIDMNRTEQLRGCVGKDRLLVGESGVRSQKDARRLRETGADAALVGEALMRSSSPEVMVKELSLA